ncbi:MAG: calcium-binding protein, partial [Tepidisphaeraceae bacterium]
MIESLEFRRLLSASLNNGILTITGGAAGDVLIAENQGSHIKVIENGSKVSTFKTTKVNHIVFNGLAGNDTLTNRSSKPSIMNGGSDFDTMIGSPTVGDDFNGGSESDTVTYASRTQNLLLSIGAGADGANGGAEGDNIRPDVERVVGGSGNDVMTGSANADVLEGGPGNDEMHGLGGDDNLIGSIGNDLLDGGDDSDNMDGGAGDDRYFETQRFLPTVDTMTDSGGIDTLDFSGSFTKLDIDMALDAGQVQDLNGDASARLFGVFENAIGGPFSTQLRGNEANNILDNRFATFDSTVDGRGGNDWLIGSPETDDNMFGGGGDDLLDGVSSERDGGDFIDGGTGFDTLDLSHRSNDLEISTDSDAANQQDDGELNESDEVRGVEHVICGSGNDEVLLGDDADKTANYWFEGRGGRDTLANVTGLFVAGTGNCTLQGGEGNDPLLFGGDGDGDRRGDRHSRQRGGDLPLDRLLPGPNP